LRYPNEDVDTDFHIKREKLISESSLFGIQGVKTIN